ncbi:MAG: hypothetical protein PHN39_00710 [Candidatus Pacebacteria bacterium]|nr:hypothetical protein [Candidatus Paceibacterota bacterium]
MGIVDFIIKSLSPANNSSKQASKPASAPAVEPEEKSFWGTAAYMSKESLRLRAERMPSKIDGFYNPVDREHRKKMLQEIFGEPGNYISKIDYKKRLEELEKKRQKATGYNEKKEIENLIKFYRAFDKTT